MGQGSGEAFPILHLRAVRFALGSQEFIFERAAAKGVDRIRADLGGYCTFLHPVAEDLGPP